MTQFFTPLRYENLDGHSIRLLEPFEFHLADGDVIRVPAGFECDGQSYPRLLQFIDTPQGRGAKAGVVHDHLYWLNGRPASNGKTYSRKEADDIYYDALKASGLNLVSCAVRYRALRLFGWAAWNAHTKRVQKEKMVRPLETL